MAKHAALYVTSRGRAGIEAAYDDALRQRLEARYALPTTVVDSLEALEALGDAARDCELIFTTWGMLTPDEATIARLLPRLRAIFYAAGSVQAFARPFLTRGVRIFSAAQANAIPVVEYCVATILLSNKGFWQSAQIYRGQRRGEAQAYTGRQPGNYDTALGIIGAGAIGRGVIEALKALQVRLDILVFDPFLAPEAAEALGVSLVQDLPELFARCQIVSNHLANNDQTAGMIDRRCFERMAPNATFINSGRGRQVVEADLIAALEAEPERTAVLDVTWPEPPAPDSPLFQLPNVILTPHIAGSLSQEIRRMGAWMEEAAEDWAAGRTSPHEVSLAMLETMA